MISLVHFNSIAITRGYEGLKIVEAIYKCAQDNPDDYLLIYENTANVDAFKTALPELNHNAYFFSNYNQTHEDLGYVEDSPFLKINKKVTYPTWLKGTTIVCLHANLINATKKSHSSESNYLFWLNSIGRLSISLGVFNYQIPTNIDNEEFNDKELYKFVKKHFKTRWVFILMLCHIFYERRFPLKAFLKTVFYKKAFLKIDVTALQRFNKKETDKEFDYEVIIPTMGRSIYLKNVLLDLSVQTVLPQKVIIIEQNEDTNSKSELDYLYNENWPFIIDHEFIHQTGACNARNKAILKTNSEWVLLFDDDNRFDKNLLKRIFNDLLLTNAQVLNMAYLQKGEIESLKSFKQWPFFGSGCSIVNREVLEKCRFDMSLEHGYGEDADYGMQIRNAGYDVVYTPQIQILHLKAPVGGFRKPHVFPWQNDEIKPKPSPQIMYYRTKNYTQKQLLGYKVILFFKFYRDYSIKNPFSYYAYFKKAWNKSLYWSQKLAQNAQV